MRAYRAFISCCHVDQAWGERVHRALERFRTPAALREHVGRFGPPPPRIGPIYRHSAELPTSADLGDAIRRALRHSSHLVVICSPAAARSRWVNEEILEFKRFGGADRIVCVMFEGEPWSDDLLSNCLPPALALRHTADGGFEDETIAPIIADARDFDEQWPEAQLVTAAGLIGFDFETVRWRHGARRRRRFNVAAGVAATAASIGLISAEIRREAWIEERAAIASARAAEAHIALDKGEERRALLAAAAAASDYPGGLMAAPRQAHIALIRTMLETRILADVPAPTLEIARLRLLPDEKLAAIDDAGHTHIIDLKSGGFETVFAPDAHAYTRISSDGRTLWTARFEAERRDEEGVVYAPLLFEEAELATGEVRLATAVKSVTPAGGMAKISPNGTRFAVDLGPGVGEETLIAVFSREAQALDGVLSAPSDRAALWFVDEDHLVVATDPPGRWKAAPGISLWRIGEDKAAVLREPGMEPVCPGDEGAVVSPMRPGVLLAPDRSEVALFLEGVKGERCLLRWDLPSGASKPAVSLNQPMTFADIVSADGPYLFGDSDRPPFIWTNAGKHELDDCRSTSVRVLSALDQRLRVVCTEESGQTSLRMGASGAMRWTGDMHSGELLTLTYDRPSARMATAGADGRIKIWDVAARGRLAGDEAPKRPLTESDGSHSATSNPGDEAVIDGLSALGDVSVSPDGSRALLIETDDESETALIDLGSGEMIARFPKVDDTHDPTIWSNAGDLVVSGGKTLKIYAARDKPQVDRSAVAGDEICAGAAPRGARNVALSPTGEMIAFETKSLEDQWALQVFDLLSCSPLLRTSASVNAPPRFVDDGRLEVQLEDEVLEIDLSIDPRDAYRSITERLSRIQLAE